MVVIRVGSLFPASQVMFPAFKRYYIHMNALVIGLQHHRFVSSNMGNTATRPTTHDMCFGRSVKYPVPPLA